MRAQDRGTRHARGQRMGRLRRGVRVVDWRPGDVEALEARRVPAQVLYSNGVMEFLGGAGESNHVILDVVSLSGQNWVRIQDLGAGVTILPPGAPVVADSGTSVRVPAAGLAGVEIYTFEVDELGITQDANYDRAEVRLGSALPAQMVVHLGLEEGQGDAVTIQGTGGDDVITTGPARGPDGARGLVAHWGGKSLIVAESEQVTWDLSGAGQDLLSLNRYIQGLGETVTFQVTGGGAGEDVLELTAPGSFGQRFHAAGNEVWVEEISTAAVTYLGPSDNVAIQQPVVAVEVIEEIPGEDPFSLGPEVFNTFLLDTGASGIVFTAQPTSELRDWGYQTAGQYMEQGVAGFELMDVSIPYRFDYAGNDGQRFTIPEAQFLTSDTLNFSFFGPWGILGMPAMVDKVTHLDMSLWSNPSDLEDLSIRVAFGETDPASSARRRTVDVPLVEFPASGQLPGGPIPTFAPLPYIPVKVRNEGKEVSGYFLLDTGAQLSVLSTQTAIAVGLDKNGNGSIEDEAFDFTEVSGIGGTTQVPLLAVDRVAVPTNEGNDLVWSEILVAIIDIEVEDGPSLAGVFGMDFLTSGWAAKILPALLGIPGSDEDGYFSQMYFDFRNDELLQGRLNFDISANHDLVTPAPANRMTVTQAGIDRISFVGSNGDDVFEILPSTVMPYAVDGGPHSAGDTLVILPGAPASTFDGSVVRTPGHQDIAVMRVENVTGVATTLQVSQFEAMASGFRVRFNSPIVPSDLNLYSSEAAPLGPADVVLTGPGGVVNGTLVVAPDGLSVTFLSTGGILAAGSYQVTLRSAGNGFHRSDGSLLDGNGDGTAGDDRLITMVVDSVPSGTAVLEVGDLVLGPTQTGELPLVIRSGNGVTSGVFDLFFDPNLLQVTGVAAGSGAPLGSVVTVDTSVVGRARVSYTGGSALSGGGGLELARLDVSIPAGAGYTTKQRLDLERVSLSAGAASVAAVVDDGVHVVAYPGDLTNDGRLTSGDVTVLRRVIVGLDSGFGAYQLADPRLVGDLDNSGGLTSLDVTNLRREIVGLDSAFIPATGAANPTIVGPDPRLWLESGGVVRAGGRIDVPVMMEVTDPAGAELAGFDLAIGFDAALFRVRDVQPGVWAAEAGFRLTWHMDAKRGVVRILGERSVLEELVLVHGDGGDLAVLRLEARRGGSVRGDAISRLNLRAGYEAMTTGLTDGAGVGLLLVPAPTDAADGPEDGVVRIVGGGARSGIKRISAQVVELGRPRRDEGEGAGAIVVREESGWIPAGPLGLRRLRRR